MSAIDRDTRVQFGHAVRRRRLALHLSQVDIERATGIDRTYISQIERGTRFPISTFLALASALGWSPDDAVAATGLAAWELIECNVALAGDDLRPETAPEPELIVPRCVGPTLLRSHVHPNWLTAIETGA